MMRILREGESVPVGALEVGEQDVIKEETIQYLSGLKAKIEKVDHEEMLAFFEDSIKELLEKQKNGGCTRAEHEFIMSELSKIIEFVMQKSREKMEKDLADIDNLFTN